MNDGRRAACSIATASSGSAGDRFRAFVLRHHGLVWRSLRRLGVADGDVDDACQQVFLVAHRRIVDIAPDSERSFLFQTALRVAADWRKAHRRRGERVDADVRDLPDSAAGPDDLMDRQRARALLDRVLEAMPMELRVVFVLFELEEMTMAEIATTSDLPAGTVASRLRRARQLFQQSVARLTIERPARPEPKGGP